MCINLGEYIKKITEINAEISEMKFGYILLGINQSADWLGDPIDL